MNQAMIFQLMGAFAGSLGFAIIFKIKGKQVRYAAIGGFLTWIVYLVAFNISKGFFAANLMASIFAAIYSEIMARVNRAPATIFLTVAAITLIPGKNLYYTMYGVITEDNAMSEENGVALITVALAIATGFTIVAIITKYIRSYRNNKIMEKKKMEGGSNG